MRYPGTILRHHHLLARKELGQNFLADPKAAEMIVNRADISTSDIVLEIGAGLGALTIPAARKAGQMFAVEKDARLAPVLKDELHRAGIENAEVLNMDIFKVDFHALAREKKLVVMGNLPYNISSQILIRLVEKRACVKKAVFMLQKELAQRIAAKPGGKTYGRLSAVMQYSARIRSLADLGPQLFFPKPEVDSRVIEITFFEKTSLSREKETFLYKVIKAAFSKRRKTLKNSLSGRELNISPEQAQSALRAAGIDPVKRAETLHVSEFTGLSHVLWGICKTGGENG